MRHFRIAVKAFFDRNYNILFNRSKCVKIKHLCNNSVPYTYGSIVSLEDGRELKCLGNFWFVEREYRVLRLDGGYEKLRDMFELLNDFRESENNK